MKDLEYLQAIIDPITYHKISYDRTVGESGVEILIDGDKTDKQILIGAKGRNIDAIRRLLSIYGRKNKEIFNIIVRT